MNSRKLNTLIGVATFVIVYGMGVLIFLVLSYGGNFFVKKNPNMVTLYTFFTGVAILLFIALWIKTEKKIIIIINTSIAVSVFLFTPTLANTYYTASDDFRILFNSNHKNEIQAIEKTIQDQNLPFSLYKKESLHSSKYHNYLAILVVKTLHSKLTSEEIYSFIAKMPKNKMSISFDDMIDGQVVIVETDENRSITNCFPEETCSSLQIK